MTGSDRTYEPPMLVEVGDFTELTLGFIPGFSPDWFVRFLNLCPNGC